MNSRKSLFAILGGMALATLIGFLLTPYKDSSKRGKIAHKINKKADEVGETVSDVKNHIKAMDEEVDRMVNEGGKVS